MKYLEIDKNNLIGFDDNRIFVYDPTDTNYGENLEIYNTFTNTTVRLIKIKSKFKIDPTCELYEYLKKYSKCGKYLIILKTLSTSNSWIQIGKFHFGVLKTVTVIINKEGIKFSKPKALFDVNWEQTPPKKAQYRMNVDLDKLYDDYKKIFTKHNLQDKNNV